MSASAPKLFSLSRTTIIASNTFTQLVRMKVFYFLAAFAAIIIAANFFEMPYTEGPEARGERALTVLKSASFGAMTLFSTIFAIVATALLLPRDVEDRTLYTILAKPVPRLDYLLGKLLGVLMLIGISLLIMDILTVTMLHFRTNGIISEAMQSAHKMSLNQEQQDLWTKEILKQGPTWSLQVGVLAIFLKAGIIAALAMLISTFSSSTLFTVAISSLIYFIGHFQADARDYWVSQAEGGQVGLTKIMTGLLAVFFPDFQVFNIIDAVIIGETIALASLWKLIGLSVMYMAIYTILSWFVFSDKEF